MTRENKAQIRQANYEAFMIIITFLSWVNLFLFLVLDDPNAKQVVVITMQLLTVFFLIDFVYRLQKASSRSSYFFKNYGWLDLLGSFPFLSLARSYRVVQTVRYFWKQGSRRFLAQFLSNRADTAVLTVVLAVIFLVEFASIFILIAEGDAPQANIHTAGDAIWWVIVTVATVGYGDLYPVTGPGRSIATIVIIAGVGLFGVLSGFLARNFLGSSYGVPGMGDMPSAASLDNILAEIQQLRVEHKEMCEEYSHSHQEFGERLKSLEHRLDSFGREKEK